MNANPPAGWYPDPHGQAELRYWDGTTWTEHTSGEAVGAGPTQIDQPQAAAAPEAGAAQYETQEPFAGGGPATAGAAPGRTGGPPKGLLIGLGALAAVGVLVGLLFLTGVLGGDDEGGGNGRDDEEQIRAVIEDTIENYDDPDICDNWTDDYHDSVEGGKDNCAPELELNSEQDFEIKDVQVDGDEATADVEIDNEDAELELKKEGDDWLIDNEVPKVCCIGGFAENGTTAEETTDGGGGGGGGAVESEVREVVNRFIVAVQEEDAQEFCNVTSIKFARDRGVRGSDDEVIDKCVDEAPRMINELIIASDPEIDTVTAPGGNDFQTVNVTLTDSSVLNVIGSPGEFWFVDTFR
jgi:hypothetical protein